MNEELATNFKLHINHWADTAARKAFVRDVTFEGRMISDVYDGLRLRAFSHLQQPIPHSLQHKRVFLSSKLAVSVNSSVRLVEHKSQGSSLNEKLPERQLSELVN
ncbi:hypothetical protein [Nostoc sp. CHAB 5715]|uniref:hypothetical protein n=1 Tax=Nostoc sp. CHAB 5715 TaxID=2780400 RepID=UPI001E2A1B9E|nr:hypothetical protein [Nostoc sp. CHAB 5715]MCC5622048.1 hypothetical protein [Nostoc sp. CHAB 5715]